MDVGEKSEAWVMKDVRTESDRGDNVSNFNLNNNNNLKIDYPFISLVNIHFIPPEQNWIILFSFISLYFIIHLMITGFIIISHNK